MVSKGFPNIIMVFFCCSNDVDCSGNIYLILPLLYLLIMFFLLFQGPGRVTIP